MTGRARMAAFGQAQAPAPAAAPPAAPAVAQGPTAAQAASIGVRRATFSDVLFYGTIVGVVASVFGIIDHFGAKKRFAGIREEIRTGMDDIEDRLALQQAQALNGR